MSEMVERVAKAIVARRKLPSGCSINWDCFREDARAAIEAMREPTEEMKNIDPAYYGRCPTCGGVEQSWPAMIDAALGDQGEGEE